MSNNDFSGKVVIITGSTSGIGEGIAIYLSKLGVNVVITGRNEQNVKRVSNLCESVSPKKLKPLEVVADITSESDAKRLIDTTIAEFGKLDVLVNNAGANWPMNFSDQRFMDSYEKVMQLNLRAVVFLTHLAVGYLEKTKGNIINISSIGAIKPLSVTTISYCMAKSALDMFTKCSAIELGSKGIRVNSIVPGAVYSNIKIAEGYSKEQSNNKFEDYRKRSPLGIVGKPQDIANLVAFLASNNAQFITGSTVVADAGFVL